MRRQFVKTLRVGSPGSDSEDRERGVTPNPHVVPFSFTRGRIEEEETAWL